jgi:hypothetical protein
MNAKFGSDGWLDMLGLAYPPTGFSRLCLAHEELALGTIESI